MTLPASETGSRWLFVDTSAFYASANEGDPNFSVSQRILLHAEREGIALVTTTYIVAECHALFLARRGRAAAVRFLRGADNGRLAIVRPDEDDEGAAREIIYRYTDKDFSLTDAISFAVMERLNISTAFTFDRDFERYGISIARP